MANETSVAVQNLCKHFTPATWHRHCILQAVHQLPDPPERVVYFIGAPIGPIKIGYATDLKKRLCGLQVGNPGELSVYAYWPCAEIEERHAHEHFSRYRIRGEWFDRSPRLIRTIRSIQYALIKPLGLKLIVPNPNEWADLDDAA